MKDPIWFQKYRIINLLGKGSTSQVYLAEHIYLESYRAIKFISKNNPFYDIQRKEAFILKSLKHSCIPIIYDIEENEEGSYIIEQYFEGPSLKEFLKENMPLSAKLIQSFGIQLCGLIQYLHSEQSPILYLDLKPENIIVQDDLLKLVDFGSAKYRDELTKEENYCGTRGYAAPELYEKQIIDERCDVYSIGQLLYAMVGRDSKIKTSMDKVIHRCIKYNPSQRYTSVKQLERALLKTNHLKKSSIHLSEQKPIKIAIAGSQHRIGVTHLSIRLCNYYIQQGCKCIYIEENSTEALGQIIRCYHKIYAREGQYKVGKLWMLPKHNRLKVSEHAYDVLVYDMGILSDDNQEDFLGADVRYLVAGGKDWELSETERAIKLISEYKETKYLFNLLDGRQFTTVARNMGKAQCYRIPYQPDPFSVILNHQEKSFFQEIQ